MTYATVTQVAKRLGNATIGTAGSTLVTDTELAEILDEIDGVINIELLLAANTTDARFAKGLAKIEVDLAAMMIIQIRQFKENNLNENPAGSWMAVPDFTPAHVRMLKIILTALQPQVYVYRGRAKIQ